VTDSSSRQVDFGRAGVTERIGVPLVPPNVDRERDAWRRVFRGA
jgi:hypothetical protein